MRVLVIGAGKLGMNVIAQLRKNPEIEVYVADGRDEPEAVKRGVVEKLDVNIQVTALNFQEIVRDINPDLVLLSRTVEDWGQEDNLMGMEYVRSMEREICTFNVPVLPICPMTFVP